MLRRLICGFLAAFVSTICVADTIGGFWKHAEEPGWIEISMESGTGVVVRNDVYPERVGRKILKDIAADEDDANTWNAQVFAERLGGYRDARIVLASPERMDIKVKVGFISRTIEWTRVDEVAPAATPD